MTNVLSPYPVMKAPDVAHPWGSSGALGGAAASKCCQNPICFSSVQRRKVEAEFNDGALTNNRGISLPDVGTLVIAPH